MTGEILLIPSFEGQINSLLLAISSFALLAGLLVGVVNTIKKPLGFLGVWFFVIPMLLGVSLLCSMVLLFGDVFTISYGQAAFFGVFVGMGAIGLYEAGLGKKETEKTTEVFELSQ